MVRLVSRAIQSVLVVFVAASFSFLLLQVAPGDPISTIADLSRVPPDLIEQWKEQQGFNDPVLEQYTRWIGNVARGNFGRSTSEARPVINVIGERLPRTILLMGLALTASVVFGSMLGAWQGARAGSKRDRAVSFVSLFLYSIPEFWFALALGFVFAYQLHLLPASGMIDVAMHDSMTPWQQLVDRARHLVLPWVALTVTGAAIFSRYQRVSMTESLQEPFVRTARAKGLSESAARRQAWRNALLPIVTLVGLFFPALMTGAVFVEHVFGWPGLGSTLVDAIGKQDYFLVSACVIIGSAMTTLGSLLADVTRALIDPRRRSA